MRASVKFIIGFSVFGCMYCSSLFADLNGPLPLNYDVIISGAGPIGLLAAIEARQHDLRVLIVEKREPGPTDSTESEKSRWGSRKRVVGIDTESFNLLSDHEVILDAYSPFEGLSIHGINEERAYVNPNTRFTRSAIQVALQRELGGTISIDELEHALLKTALKKGAQVLFGGTIETTESEQNFARVRMANETVIPLVAPMFVIAEGSGGSFVNQLISEKKAQQHQLIEPIPAVIAIFDKRVFSNGEYRLYLGDPEDAPIFGLALSDRHTTSIYAAGYDGHPIRQSEQEEVMASLLKALKVDASPVAILPFQIRSNHLDKFVFSERFFVVGDAGATTHTAAGYNITSGFRQVVALREVFKSLTHPKKEFLNAAHEFETRMRQEAEFSRYQTTTIHAAMNAGRFYALRSVARKAFAIIHTATKIASLFSGGPHRDKSISSGCAEVISKNSYEPPKEQVNENF